MAQLQAQVQASPRPFSEIQQDPLYVNADASQQALAAQEYFNQYVATQSAYKQAKPEQQKAAFDEFVTQYNIPMPQRQPITAGQPMGYKPRPQIDYNKSGILGQVSRGLDAANLYGGAVVDPFVNTFTFGLASSPQDIEKQYQQQYPGIESDSGFLGDAYRFHQNHYANLAGNALGGFGGVGNIQKGLAGLGVAGKALFPASIGAFSGATNTVNTLKGNQTPLEAIGNTALDVALSPLGGKSRLSNATVQALAGGAGGVGASLLQDIANGNALDWAKAQQMGIEQAALGGGMGAAFTPTPKQRPAITGRVVAEGAPYGDFGPTVGTYNRSAKKLTTNAKAKNALVKRLVDLYQSGRTNEASTLVREITRGLSVRDSAVFKDEVRLKLKEAKEAAKPVKTEKQNLQAGSDQFKAVVDFIAELRAAGRAKEADVALGQFSRDTKAKVYDSVRAKEREAKATKAEADQAAKERAKAANERVKQKQAEDKQRVKELAKQEVESKKQQALLKAKAEKIQNQKEKQAVMDQIALEKAQAKRRRAELIKLKGEIISRNKEIADAERTEAKAVKDQLPGDVKLKGITQDKMIELPLNKEPAQTQASKLKLIKAAIDKKQVVRLEYEAEKSGETGTYRFKDVVPYEVEVNKNGVVQVRGINSDGQMRTYLLGSDKSGSKIVSVEATKTPSPFEIFTNENGKLQVRQTSGELVAQVQKDGVKSSEIRANIQKMEEVLKRVKQNDQVSIREISEAVKGINEKQFVDELPDGNIEKIAKEADCQ